MTDKQVSAIALWVMGVVTVIAVSFVVSNFIQLSSKEKSSQVIEHLNMPTDVNKNSTLYFTYSSLEGEKYDEKFIPTAVAHYENLINMITLASRGAKHQEIKDFVDKLNPELNEQLNTLESMKKSIPESDANHDAKDVDHKGSSIEEKSSADMKLKKLTGDEFDKELLRLMILNFEDMVNMAAAGEKNAKDNQLKQLTKDIVASKKVEMQKLHTWQMQWYGMDM